MKQNLKTKTFLALKHMSLNDLDIKKIFWKDLELWKIIETVRSGVSLNEESVPRFCIIMSSSSCAAWKFAKISAKFIFLDQHNIAIQVANKTTRRFLGVFWHRFCYILHTHYQALFFIRMGYVYIVFSIQMIFKFWNMEWSLAVKLSRMFWASEFCTSCRN